MNGRYTASMRPAVIAIPLLLAVSCPKGEVVSHNNLQGEEIGNCRQETKVGNAVITLDDARRIRAAADQYLGRDSKLQTPGPPFIDCEGVVRLGAWVLEPLADGELRLAFRTVSNEHLIVRQEMRIRRDGESWTPVSMSEVTYHARY
jgi:hypothetical protein